MQSIKVTFTKKGKTHDQREDTFVYEMRKGKTLLPKPTKNPYRLSHLMKYLCEYFRDEGRVITKATLTFDMEEKGE